MAYEIKKAPSDLFNNARGNKRNDYPLEKLKVGEMFEVPSSKKSSIYNAIKHRRNYTKELEGWAFTLKEIGDGKIAVIRLI